MIGVGMQGSGLLANAIGLPGIECVAAADLYDGRHTLAKEITNNSNLPTTRRYQELLDRKDIDCIVAAVPDHWHKRVVVDACNAGKDIYCEKPMSHTIAQGYEMVEAAKRNSRIVQIGSQRVSSVLCAKARELYHNGAIGVVEIVELSLGRNSPNGAWQYPPPLDLSGKRRLGHMAKRRAQNSARQIPVRTLAMLERVRHRRWRRPDGPSDQRNVVYAQLERASAIRFRVGRNFSLEGRPQHAGSACRAFRLSRDSGLRQAGPGTETPELARFLGPKGILDATGSELRYSPQTGEDTRPSYYSGGFPAKMREQYVSQWLALHAPQPGHEPVSQDMVYTGNDWDDVRPHLWNFFRSVKSRKPVMEDAVFGNHAAIACHMANESYFRKKPVYWDAESRNIRS